MSLAIPDTIAHAIAISNSTRFVSERYACEMDVRDTRLKRLAVLLEQHGGSKDELARALKKAPAQISQWFNHVRTITEESAREIEERLKLPAGWLDQDVETLQHISAQSPSGIYIAWPFRSIKLADIAKLTPEMLERLERVIQFHLGEMLLDVATPPAAHVGNGH